MAWTDLKAAVAAVIKTNGNQEITGAVLQSTLNSIIDQVGANATFKGMAVPATAPGTPDGKIFYFATTPGTYSNFGGLVLVEGEAAVLVYGTSWTKETISINYKTISSEEGYYIGVSGSTLIPMAYPTSKLSELLKIPTVNCKITGLWQTAGSAPAIAFVDSEYNLIPSNAIYISGGGTIVNGSYDWVVGTPVIPAGAKYIVCQAQGYDIIISSSEVLSTGISFISIRNLKISNDTLRSKIDTTIEDLGNKNELNQIHYVADKYLDISGRFTNEAGFGCKYSDKIACEEGDKFYYEGVSEYGVAGWLLWNGDTLVSCGQKRESPPFSIGTAVIEIPAGVDSIQFGSYGLIGPSKRSIHLKFYRISPLINLSKINQLYEEVIGYDVSFGIDRYMTGAATFHYDAGLCMKKTNVIPCVEGDVFRYDGISNYCVAGWIFWNTTTIVNWGQSNGITEVVIPAGVNGIQFSSYAYDSTEDAVVLEILKLSKKSLKAQSIENKEAIESLSNQVSSSMNGNVLFGKKWVACGDSFTAGDFTGLTDPTEYQFQDNPYLGQKKVYPFYIGRRNNMTIINEAIGGSIVALDKTHVDSPGTVDINTRFPFSYQRYLNIAADADYITFWFGINDNANTYLGTIDDTTNTSFYGAWNVVLEYLITNHPVAKMGFFITNGTGPTYKQATREIAKKWGIPYLDISGDIQVPAIFERETDLGYSSVAHALRYETFRVSPTNGHPNAVAHEYQSTFIENFLRSL